MSLQSDCPRGSPGAGFRFGVNVEKFGPFCQSARTL